jgi:ATP-dependent DNA helicase RecG
VDLLNAGRSDAHRTLIFDEFFVLELGLALTRRGYQKEEGIAFEYKKGVHDEFKAGLPFTLTSAQKG